MVMSLLPVNVGSTARRGGYALVSCEQRPNRAVFIRRRHQRVAALTHASLLQSGAVQCHAGMLPVEPY